MPFQWHPDEPPPEIEEHSKALEAYKDKSTKGRPTTPLPSWPAPESSPGVIRTSMQPIRPHGGPSGELAAPMDARIKSGHDGWGKGVPMEATARMPFLNVPQARHGRT